MIDREVLKELGVNPIGHALAILKLAKEQPLTSNRSTPVYLCVRPLASQPILDKLYTPLNFT